MSNENQHIPSGYKPSPLGPIPEDWEVKRLGEVVTVNSGKDYKHLSTGNIPVYGTGGYMLSVNDRLSDIDAVGIGRKGTIDKPQYLRAHFWTVDTLFFLTTKEKYDLRFVFNLSQLVEWKKYSEQTGVPSLTSKSINNIQIPVPPLPEQHRIVSVLQLWDTAISKQAQLVEKLTLRKRGLMQQLLTGKKRLKGFEGEWKMVKLGECGNFLSNNTLSREQLNERSGTVQNIHYGDVLIKYLSILDCDKVTLPFINESAYKDSMTDFVKDGDIVISDTAEDETVGKACEVQNIGTKKILAGLHTMLFRPEKGLFSPFFMGYYFNSEVYHSKLIPLIQGIKVCSIGKQAIQNTIVIIPSIDEQNAIASVLINADKEIEKQKQKLTNLQEQKKGLMRLLLTGKKRIKTNN